MSRGPGGKTAPPSPSLHTVPHRAPARVVFMKAHTRSRVHITMRDHGWWWVAPVLSHCAPTMQRTGTQTQTPMTAECNERHSQSATISASVQSFPGGRLTVVNPATFRDEGPFATPCHPATVSCSGWWAAGAAPLRRRNVCGLPSFHVVIVRVDQQLFSYCCTRLSPAPVL